ncbi:MAG: serine protease [Terriglobia bacterium]
MSRLKPSQLILGVILFLCLCVSYRATLVPPMYMDCVVAIGHKETTPGQNQGKWLAEASGFLYGDFISKQGDQSQYTVYLVTNRHVILDHIAAATGPLSVRFNLQSPGSAREYDVLLNDEHGKPTWHVHPDADVDLAVIPINANFLKEQGARFDFFRSESNLLTREKAKEIGLSEGDGIFVLGFPMGLVDGMQDYAIVRQGAIARIRDRLDSPMVKFFLIDSFIFPGSSGSPVVLKPEAVSIQGTKPAINQAYLVGVVQGFVSYIDRAISEQTKRPRITFEENSGLAKVVPADYIQETIQDYKKSLPPGP